MELYNFLDDIGLTTSDKIDKSIFNAKVSELFDLEEECKRIIKSLPAKNLNQPRTVFNFSASNAISGSGFGCMGMDCRLQQASMLGQFASLYGDVVTIPNYFARHVSKQDIAKDKEKENRYRYQILGDIKVLMSYRPLIEEGLIIFNQSEVLHCAKCRSVQVRRNSKRTTVKNSRHLQKYAESIIFDKVQFVLESKERIRFKDPEGYIDQHNHSIYLDKPLPGLKPPHILTRKELDDIDLLAYEASKIIGDVILQCHETESNNTTFLTPRKLDALLLEYANMNDIESSGRRLMQELPIITGGNVSALIRVRKEEEPAFNSYRHALSTVLKQLGNSPSAGDIREAVDSEIRPHLFKIDQTLQAHIKDTSSTMKLNAGISSILIAAGVFIQSKAKLDANAMAGLAAIPFISGIPAVNGMFKRAQLPVKIAEDQYYFLWDMGRNKN